MNNKKETACISRLSGDPIKLIVGYLSPREHSNLVSTAKGIREEALSGIKQNMVSAFKQPPSDKVTAYQQSLLKTPTLPFLKKDTQFVTKITPLLRLSIPRVEGAAR